MHFNLVLIVSEVRIFMIRSLHQRNVSIIVITTHTLVVLQNSILLFSPACHRDICTLISGVSSSLFNANWHLVCPPFNFEVSIFCWKSRHFQHLSNLQPFRCNLNGYHICTVTYQSSTENSTSPNMFFIRWYMSSTRNQLQVLIFFYISDHTRSCFRNKLLSLW